MLENPTILGHTDGKGDVTMVAQRAQAMQTSASINEIAQALCEVTGSDCGTILDRLAANPTHDLAIPSPQAMAVLGKLRAKHGFRVTKEDISRTKRGSFCSMKLLADLMDKKTKGNNN